MGGNPALSPGVKIGVMSETETPKTEEKASQDTPFLPPPSFEVLTLSLKAQAEVELGLLHFGEEKDRPAPNFNLAKHAIDMLSMLQEKTRGNLSIEEQRFLENSLTELRFRYVQVLEESKKS
jgi:hypothetical protein